MKHNSANQMGKHLIWDDGKGNAGKVFDPNNVRIVKQQWDELY